MPDSCLLHSEHFFFISKFRTSAIKKIAYFRKDIQPSEHLRRSITSVSISFFSALDQDRVKYFPNLCCKNMAEKSFIFQPADKESPIAWEAGAQDFAVKPRNGIQVSVVTGECWTQDMAGSAEVPDISGPNFLPGPEKPSPK